MQHGKGAPGRLQLYVDGALTGNAEAPVTTPFVLNPGALTCGANPGSAITDDYVSPFSSPAWECPGRECLTLNLVSLTHFG